MGDTALDEETFNEYLDGLRDHYRADKYHLLDFNVSGRSGAAASRLKRLSLLKVSTFARQCNSFTADVVGFLTGGTIPASISSEHRLRGRTPITRA